MTDSRPEQLCRMHTLPSLVAKEVSFAGYDVVEQELHLSCSSLRSGHGMMTRPAPPISVVLEIQIHKILAVICSLTFHLNGSSFWEVLLRIARLPQPSDSW